MASPVRPESNETSWPRVQRFGQIPKVTVRYRTGCQGLQPSGSAPKAVSPSPGPSQVQANAGGIDLTGCRLLTGIRVEYR